VSEDGKLSITNLPEVVAGLTKEVHNYEKAAVYAFGKVALRVERVAKQNALTGSHTKTVSPKGAVTWIPSEHIPGTGPGPNRRTGNLIRSIRTEMRQGFGSYVASVYPSMIYSRVVEEGSPRWKSGVKYPYLRPAAETVRREANAIFTREFKNRYRSS